jgi:putative Holliday junction resolvase
MSDSSNPGESPESETHAAATPADSFPREGRLLGLDYGTKRIGFAISTFEQNIASPLENYTRRSQSEDARRLKELVDEYFAVGLVVGLPVHMSGEEGGKASEARTFGAWASQASGLPVCYWDERLTSTMAEAHLIAAELSKKKRKARTDMLAAVFMLQSFLDAADRTRPPSAM